MRRCNATAWLNGEFLSTAAVAARGALYELKMSSGARGAHTAAAYSKCGISIDLMYMDFNCSVHYLFGCFVSKAPLSDVRTVLPCRAALCCEALSEALIG